MNKPKPIVKPIKPPTPVVKPVVVKPTSTDLQDLKALSKATFAAAKMPKQYSIFDLPQYVTYLVAKHAKQNPVLPVPTEVPTDVKNDAGTISMLTLLLLATARAAGMPTVVGQGLLITGLPAWIVKSGMLNR